MKYISLFSSAGIGTYGLHEDGHECIATNELLKKRLEIQKFNNICKNDDGYIEGDLSKNEIKQKIYNQIEKYGDPDIIIATPPCQGISLINLKKNVNDKFRNSLVVESIEIISKTNPKIFIIENVRNFLNTMCNIDGNWLSIKEAIDLKLSKRYSIAFKVINLKYIGSKSSRTRTIIIGINRSFSKHFSPWELFPDKAEKESSLWEVIGNNKKLSWAEIDKNNFYHSFRIYDKRMKDWIKNLKPGESAFNNINKSEIPHRIINGEYVKNKNLTGDKYKRQLPNKIAQCITTRNDQFASQNTIHPYEDRVFSIYELMQLMTIPKSFRFLDFSLDDLNKLPLEKKLKLYKKNEMTIRVVIGESVPTFLFKEIIRKFNYFNNLFKCNTVAEAKNFIEKNNILCVEDLISYTNKITRFSLNLCFEYLEFKVKEKGIYFTNADIVTDLINGIDFFGNEIVEPSVGLGSILIPFIKAFPEKNLNINVFDINNNSIKILKKLLLNFKNIKYHNEDFLKSNIKNVDLIIGNPPYIQVNKNNNYKEISISSKNMFELFTIKSLKISKNLLFVLPKYILYNKKYSNFRKEIIKYGPKQFWDYKSMMFPNAKIETIVVSFNNKKNKEFISDGVSYSINFLTNNISSIWTIHPNKEFLDFHNNLHFMNDTSSKRLMGINKNMLNNNNIGFPVMRSINLRDKNSEILYTIFKYEKELKSSGIFVANMSKNINATPKIDGVLWNGSLALITGNITKVPDIQKNWNSKEFLNYIDILRSRAERSINIDAEIIKHFGIKK